MANYNYLDAVKADIRKNYTKTDIVLREHDEDFLQEIRDNDDICGNWNGYKNGFENEDTKPADLRRWLLENTELVTEAYANSGYAPMLAQELLQDFQTGLWNIDASVRSYLVPKALRELNEEFSEEIPRVHLYEFNWIDRDGKPQGKRGFHAESIPEFLNRLELDEAREIFINDYYEEAETDNC